MKFWLACIDTAPITDLCADLDDIMVLTLNFISISYSSGFDEEVIDGE